MNYKELNDLLRRYKNETVEVFYDDRGKGKVVNISKVTLPDSVKETVEIDFGQKGKCSFIISEALTNILFASKSEYEKKIREEKERQEILRKLEFEKNEKEIREKEKLLDIEKEKLIEILVKKEQEKKARIEKENKERQERKDKAKENREKFRNQNKSSELAFIKSIQKNEEKKLSESKESVVKVVGKRLIVGFADEDNN